MNTKVLRWLPAFCLAATTIVTATLAPGVSLPAQAPVLKPGPTKSIMEASDNQETKNVASIGSNPMPNTTFRPFSIHAVNGPAVSWLVPPAGVCVKGSVRLGVTATSTAAISAVRFYDGKTLIAGVATCTTSFASAGTKNLTADYTGDADFTTSGSNTVTLAVNKASTSTTVGSP